MNTASSRHEVLRLSLRIIMNLVIATIACFIANLAFAEVKNAYIPTLPHVSPSVPDFLMHT